LTDLRQPRRWMAAGYSLVQWQKLRRYEAAILRAADATIAVSQADKEALQTLAPEVAIDVVSNGIDLAHYQPEPRAIATNPARIVFTGKMDYRPNIDAALWFARQVLPAVLEKEPQARFEIVGMNPHARLDELRANEAITITGAVPDTRPFIHAAAAYIIPMRVGGGTRFKALEAMACGKAIVATTLGIEGIPARHGQELLIADTPDDFAAAVTGLIADARTGGAQHRQLGQQARRFVEQHYGWQVIVPKVDEVYDRVTKGAEHD
jgi:polysaccharide biosynthesis protein PslH